MRIEIISDESISRQALIYAEYRLFAALSQMVDTGEVKNASLRLRRSNHGTRCDGVACTATVTLHSGAVARLRASGPHPYAAINRAVERLQLRSRAVADADSRDELIATE